MNDYRYSAGQFTQSFHVFKIHGTDTQSFLQAQSTSNVLELSSHSFHLSSFLDPQGRIECYGWLLKDKDEYLYLVPESLKDAALERLNRFLISEDVTIEPPLWQEWNVIVGALAYDYQSESTFSGEMFADFAILKRGDLANGPALIPDETISLWRTLSGWPTFNGTQFKKEIINNTRLFDLSVSSNKGCYPGQETVAKIATRRGAAYSPVLLESQNEMPLGSITNFGNKIGEVLSTQSWKGKHYLSASVIRDFRVEGMQFTAEINGQEAELIVRYFPLLPQEPSKKAQELFYQGADFFMKGHDEGAEASFKQALRLYPQHEDSLESLGVLLGRLGRYEEAIEWMKKLVEVQPVSVLAHTNMSVFLMKLGKIEEAEEQKSLATIKSFQKFGAEAKEKEALEQEKKKKIDEWVQRESMFLQVLEIDEEDTLANYGIGSIAVEKGEWDRAKSHLEKVLKADPKYSVAYLALGKTYAALREKQLAIETFKEGIKVAAAKGDLMPANQMQFELDRL